MIKKGCLHLNGTCLTQNDSDNGIRQSLYSKSENNLFNKKNYVWFLSNIKFPYICNNHEVRVKLIPHPVIWCNLSSMKR